MTRQEYYDLLVKSNYDGTFPSKAKDDSQCLYRLDGNPHCKQRCVVGLLIPDEKYTSDMGGISFCYGRIEILKEFYSDFLAAIVLPEGMGWGDLAALQKIHDGLAWSRTWNVKDFVIAVNQLGCFSDCVKKEV